MDISRRLFLKSGALALVSVGAVPVLGPTFLRRAVFADEVSRKNSKSGGRKTLICVFQRGAVDGLSVIVPHGDADYYKLRNVGAGGIALARAGSDGVLDLDGHFGLHPALKSLLPIYKSGHLAPIQAVGSPSSTRSHFDAQDFMETGSPDRTLPDGWAARALSHCPEDAAKLHSTFRAVSMTTATPKTFLGERDALAIPDLRTFGVKGGGADLASSLGDMQSKNAPKKDASGGFESLYDNDVGDVLGGTGRESFEAIKILKSLSSKPYQPANGAKYPNGNFGKSLSQIAQLIKADVGVEIAFAESGGWDTHVNQGGVQGQLSRRLQDFGDGLAALYADLGDRMNDVVILTMSEFGRTAKQNGNGGTDHGHATCFLALGGDVSGGKVLGDWPGLAPEQLNEKRDLAVTTDFRDVFGEVAQRHLGVTDLAAVFPNRTKQGAFRDVLRST